jgi:hypothetical protein
MPVNVTGVKELQRDLKKIEPNLNKEFTTQMRNIMQPVRDKARSNIPGNSSMLSGWTKINVTAEQKYRAFPFFDQALIQNKITYSAGKTRANRNGFSNAYYVRNAAAAGRIYEIAGTANPGGSPKSKSINPNAGIHFIESMGGQMNIKGEGNQRGRALYKAWAEDNGKVIPAAIQAINNVINKFNNRPKAA